MLVLSRKLSGSITIGDNITVKVLSIKNGTVRLGVEAPRDIRILRNELKVQCPNCLVPMVEGAYDLKSVLICPKCNHRKTIDDKPSGQEDED